MALTLKLLSAAAHTYAIVGDGHVPERGTGAGAPASAHVGWLGDGPVGHAAGPGNHNAGLVGRIRQGVVVALRGTRIPEPKPNMTLRQWLGDWAIDLDIPLEPRGGFVGQIHNGFHQGVMDLWDELDDAIAAAVAAADAAREAEGPPGPAPIFVTGHSKGGAMAPLMAWLLRDAYADRDIVVRTFAAPNVGDRDFAAAYQPRVTQHVRYEYAGDMIPHVPFMDSFFGELPDPVVFVLNAIRQNSGYVALGDLAYVRADHVIVGDSAALRGTRRDTFLNALANGAALNAKQSHLLDAGGGYCSGAYQVCRWT